MIQALDWGIGMEGKEEKQASLAADFSITQFKHISRLLMVHDRNSYKRSAALGKFVKHRGIWVLISIYQGGILMYGALLLFESEFVHVGAISFTSLILTELLMLALNICTWLMVLAEFLSLGCYIASLAFLNKYFDLAFITTPAFLWKLSVITVVSLPLYNIKYLKRKFSLPSYSKLSSSSPLLTHFLKLFFLVSLQSFFSELFF